jgi:hypothetical protein
MGLNFRLGRAAVIRDIVSIQEASTKAISSGEMTICHGVHRRHEMGSRPLYSGCSIRSCSSSLPTSFISATCCHMCHMLFNNILWLCLGSFLVPRVQGSEHWWPYYLPSKIGVRCINVQLTLVDKIYEVGCLIHRLYAIPSLNASIYNHDAQCVGYTFYYC